MSHQAEAEENLRVIRSLMEKATVYRAISAPGALLGGLVACVVAGLALSDHRPQEFKVASFVSDWVVVAALTGTTNLVLLWRGASSREEPFVSPGMRLAVRAMLPAILAGALATFAAAGCVLTATLWVLLYGTSLLAASHFAPKSICWLGRAFFVTGAILVCWAAFYFHPVGREGDAAYGIMGATFGLFHVIYAACTWPRKSASEAKP